MNPFPPVFDYTLGSLLPQLQQPLAFPPSDDIISPPVPPPLFTAKSSTADVQKVLTTLRSQAPVSVPLSPDAPPWFPAPPVAPVIPSFPVQPSTPHASDSSVLDPLLFNLKTGAPLSKRDRKIQAQKAKRKADKAAVVAANVEKKRLRKEKLQASVLAKSSTSLETIPSV